MAQDGRGQRIARIKAGFFQILQDVVESGEADADLFGDICPGRLLAVAFGGTVAGAAAEDALQFDELAEMRDTLGRPGWFALVFTVGGVHYEKGACGGVTIGVKDISVESLVTVGS